MENKKFENANQVREYLKNQKTKDILIKVKKNYPFNSKLIDIISEQFPSLYDLSSHLNGKFNGIGNVTMERLSMLVNNYCYDIMSEESKIEYRSKYFEIGYFTYGFREEFDEANVFLYNNHPIAYGVKLFKVTQIGKVFYRYLKTGRCRIQPGRYIIEADKKIEFIVDKKKLSDEDNKEYIVDYKFEFSIITDEYTGNLLEKKINLPFQKINDENIAKWKSSLLKKYPTEKRNINLLEVAYQIGIWNYIESLDTIRINDVHYIVEKMQSEYGVSTKYIIDVITYLSCNLGKKIKVKFLGDDYKKKSVLQANAELLNEVVKRIFDGKKVDVEEGYCWNIVSLVFENKYGIDFSRVSFDISFMNSNIVIHRAKIQLIGLVNGVGEKKIERIKEKHTSIRLDHWEYALTKEESESLLRDFELNAERDEHEDGEEIFEYECDDLLDCDDEEFEIEDEAFEEDNDDEQSVPNFDSEIIEADERESLRRNSEIDSEDYDKEEVDYIEDGKIFQLGETFWEDDNLKIVFAGVYRGNIKLYIANKTSRKLDIECHGFCINGFEVDCGIYDGRVLPRKKKICEVSGTRISDLGMNSIDEADYFEMGIQYTKLKNNSAENKLPWVKIKPLCINKKMISALAFENTKLLAEELQECALCAYYNEEYERIDQLLKRAMFYCSDLDYSWIALLCLKEATCSNEQLVKMGYAWLSRYCNDYMKGKISRQNFNLTGFYNLGVATSKILLWDEYDNHKIVSDLTKAWQFSLNFALKEKVYDTDKSIVKDLVLMGACFFNGNITTEDVVIPLDKDYEIASRVFTVGETYNDELAFTFKGIMYDNGILVTPNSKLAYRKFLYAAICGERNSQAFCQERYVTNLYLDKLENQGVLMKDIIINYPRVLDAFLELECHNLQEYSKIDFTHEDFINALKCRCGEGRDDDLFIIELECALSDIEQYVSERV